MVMLLIQTKPELKALPGVMNSISVYLPYMVIISYPEAMYFSMGG